ncbi:MAG TPA: alkaline phosphatase family protein [Candidatus Baltobacteraceae bacterium]|nr:alkaline phosphatase family protein [Candidatus Baltobacteraceae bacterium]
MKLRVLLAAASLAAVAAAPLFSAAVSPAQPTPMQIDRLLAQHIKHIFVIYQENRSFDAEFGTFPGANGIWSAQARAHGFAQIDPITHRSVTPFRLTDPDVYYESNARDVQLQAFDGGKMDRFVAAQGSAVMQEEKSATPAQRFSVGAESMYHIDCAAIPYLWAYAKRFTLFDNFYQALRGPSTPSNVEIIAAQNGLTEYARNPKTRAPNASDPGDPIFVDLDPAFGPYNPAQPPKKTQLNQRYANVLLTMQRKDVGAVTQDTGEVREDKAVIAKLNGAAIPWRWYEEGYATPRHIGLIAHHLAPQYFGYVVKNRSMVSNMRDVTAFYDDLALGRLPDRGVFYVKGGSHNTLGLRPANHDPYVQKHFLGDDDHPGYTDSQISEAFVASTVSAIARSKYWKDSAIVITWDDLGGFWDHVTPHNFETCPDGHPCGDGARVPAIVISPYGKTGVIVHDLNDQDSVIKFVETVFHLPTFASLPDEKRYLPLGPRDGNTLLSNLRGAFDYGRLAGTKPPLSRDGAIFADRTIHTIPAPVGCRSIGVQPAPPPPGTSDAPPPGFNPRPFEPTPAPQ